MELELYCIVSITLMKYNHRPVSRRRFVCLVQVWHFTDEERINYLSSLATKNIFSWQCYWRYLKLASSFRTWLSQFWSRFMSSQVVQSIPYLLQQWFQFLKKRDSAFECACRCFSVISSSVNSQTWDFFLLDLDFVVLLGFFLPFWDLARMPDWLRLLSPESTPPTVTSSSSWMPKLRIVFFPSELKKSVFPLCNTR